MSRFFFTLFLLLSLSLTTFAQEPAKQMQDSTTRENAPSAGSWKTEGIELPADQSVGHDEGFVNVQAKCKGQVKWLVVSGTKVKYMANEPTNSIIISIPPQGGLITVFAVGLVDNKLTEFVSTNINVKNGAPSGPVAQQQPPNGAVNPVPPVGGPAPAGPLHVTFVLDLNSATPEMAKILNSQTMRKAITDRGCFLRILDSKSPVIAQKKLANIVGQVGGPAMIIQKNDGSLVMPAQAVPATEQDVINIVNRLVGGG